jgi:hypothetical protein
VRMVADSIATPISHIFNLSLEENVCPQAWREDKVIPLPKSGNAAFTADLRAFCQLLSNSWKKNVFDQIQCYFSVNK